MIMPQTNKTYQTIDNRKDVDTNIDSITVVENLEVEDDSLEIMTIDHDDGFIASDTIKKDKYVDCPYKDRTDLKFYNSCAVGDLSLEDCPTILDKINKNPNVNVFYCVQKSDIICRKNLHIVTIQGAKIGEDNPRISRNNDASNMF